MSDLTRVQFANMAQGEESFLAVFNSLTSTLESLQNELQSSLTQWEGSAQAAYQVAKSQWQAAAADMANVLSNLGKVIGVANLNYQSTEQRLSAMWGG